MARRASTSLRSHASTQLATMPRSRSSPSARRVACWLCSGSSSSIVRWARCRALETAAAELARDSAISAAAVSSALQRAHRTIDELLPEQSQQATLRALGDERLRGIVASWVEAWERNDVDALLA